VRSSVEHDTMLCATYSFRSIAEKACGSALYGVRQAGHKPFRFSRIWCQHHMHTCVR
jgi:hypothetical protein